MTDLPDEEQSAWASASEVPLVVIGASAGGVASRQRFVAALPADLPAAIAVVLHLSPTSPSVLPAILDRAGPLPVRVARHGRARERGCIVVAPPDHHLLLEDGVIELSRSATENGLRPAVDALFRSAARHWGPLIGIVLSCALDDGARGLAGIKDAGGLAMVEDPKDAAYPSMPEAARNRVDVDAVGRPEELAQYVVHSLAGGGPVRESARKGPHGPYRLDELTPRRLSCPDCHATAADVTSIAGC